MLVLRTRFLKCKNKIDQDRKKTYLLWKPQVSSSIEMINSGNYNYNYGHLFFGKDLKNSNIKLSGGEKDAHLSENCRSLALLSLLNSSVTFFDTHPYSYLRNKTKPYVISLANVCFIKNYARHFGPCIA